MSKKSILILLITLSLPAAWQLLQPGFYEPHDTHHMVDIYEMTRAISSGQIPPRLSPDMTYGFSYPLYNFYYVMPFYLASLIFFTTNSLIWSFKGVMIISIMLSSVGMYIFLREFLGRAASFTGALVYLYTPYRAVQLYVRGAIGEAFVMALMPFIFYLLIKFVNKSNVKNFTLASLGLSIFILSHNYLWAFAGIAFGVLYFILYWDPTSREATKDAVRKLVYLIEVGALALGVAAYWWVPAIIEQKLVAPTTPFKMIDHFPFIKQLVVPSWGYGASVWGPGDGLSFQIGIVNLMVVVIAILLLIKNNKNIKNPEIRLGVWAVLGFLGAVFMMNIRSYFIWENVPFISFVQFPWRFLFLTTLFTAVLTGVVVELAPKKNTLLISGLLIILAIDMTSGYFMPSKRVFKQDQDYLSRFLLSETYSEDYLQLPNWTEERPVGVHSEFVWGENVSNYSDEVHRLVEHNLEIEMSEDGRANLALYYFPGWFGEVDGERVNLSYGKPYGQIKLDLTKGSHNVRVWWGETRLRLMADLISVGSLVILYLVYKRKVKVF